MKYVYSLITLSLTKDSLELTTTAAGDRFLKSKLSSAMNVGGPGYSQVKFTKSSLLILGELLKDVEEPRTESVSEFLGVLDGDVGDEIVGKLFWDGSVRITKGEGG